MAPETEKTLSIAFKSDETQTAADAANLKIRGTPLCAPQNEQSKQNQVKTPSTKNGGERSDGR